MAGLEATFGVPVIEAYGMTEAAHQMASNPLPPRVRKPGSVGPAVGTDIAVMDPSGRVLPNGDTGEIVIRGANVTSGYESIAADAAASFADGWFRTGDEGHLDADGYVHISGRLKEIINKGGEKIRRARSTMSFSPIHRSRRRSRSRFPIRGLERTSAP